MDKCDRCGREYKEELFPSVHLTILYPNPMQSHNAIWLCPQCQEELLEWMEKGVKESD